MQASPNGKGGKTGRPERRRGIDGTLEAKFDFAAAGSIARPVPLHQPRAPHPNRALGRPLPTACVRLPPTGNVPVMTEDDGAARRGVPKLPVASGRNWPMPGPRAGELIAPLLTFKTTS